MVLPAGQQRALDVIESALEARDPRMTAMFAMFARLTGREAPTDVEGLPRPGEARWRRGLLPLFLLAAAGVAILAGLVTGVLTGGAPACRTAFARDSRPALSCASRPSPPPGEHGQYRNFAVLPGMAT